MADQFPPEIIYDILSRLPIKSLGRFRCVCKLWFKYINDPYLETIHVKEEPTPIMLERFEPDNNYPKRLFKISLLRVTQGTCTKEPIMKKWYRDSEFFWQNKLLLGSCNGLTLVSYQQDPYDLPPAKTGVWYGSPAAGIGFDESTSTLKTVCVILKRLHDISARPKQLCTMVYSSGMRLWRVIAQKPPYPIRGEGVFAHGRLHWLASLDYIYLWYNMPDYAGRKIVWFDVKLEEFGLRDPPKQNLSGFKTEDQVVDLNGELGYVFFGCFNLIELWILNKEEWTLHCCIPLHLGMFKVAVSGCLNKNGDILLTSDDRGRLFVYHQRRLFVYTLKTGDLQQVNVDDQHESDIRMYQSSLFSIRDYSVRNRTDQREE